LAPKRESDAGDGALGLEGVAGILKGLEVLEVVVREGSLAAR
jgi:hypothetical protein